MKINILHFSDFHFSQQRSDECRHIGVHLAESTANTPVDAIIFTGDMVQDVSDKFEPAYEALINNLKVIGGEFLFIRLKKYFSLRSKTAHMCCIFALE